MFMPSIFVIGLNIHEYVICIKLYLKCRVLLQKLVKKLPTFYSARWFTAVISTAGRPFVSDPSHINLSTVSILSL